jgi:hypothetical protein
VDEKNAQELDDVKRHKRLPKSNVEELRKACLEAD